MVQRGAAEHPAGRPATNRFVEGDNLPVMAGLPAGSVDLVYLDPPYNAASGLVYADDLRAGGGLKGAAGRHAAWVEMMRPRLVQAHRVTSARGVVAVSIDDHEMAHLRLLLDEVWGEEHRLAQVVVELNPKGRQLGSGFATSHEYLLVHARDASRCVLDPSSAESVDPGDFPLTAPDGRRFRHLPLRNTNKKFNPATAPTLHYPLWGDPVSGAVAAAAFDGALEITPVFGDGRPAVWRWSRPRVEARSSDLVCRRIRGRTGERVDLFQRDWLDPGRRKKLRTVWHAAEVGSTDTAVAELKALVGPVFDTPKPTGLLRRVLGTLPPDVTVLDAFAGSGATGHAVALANAADDGTRTCLSLNRAEPVRPGSNAAAAGLASVADITRARLRAVAEHVGGGYVETSAAEAAAALEAGMAGRAGRAAADVAGRE